MFLIDGFKNFVANMGTSRDKASHGAYYLTLRDWQSLETAYRTSPLARKIVDIPAEDAGREWREWQAEDDQISAIEAEEKRLGVQGKLIRTSKAARLYGGGAIYIGTRDTDLSKPLDPKTIGRGGVRYLTVLSRIELAEGELQNDPREPGFGLPAYYTMSAGNTASVPIHPSRLVILTGEETPSRSLSALDSWGDSVLQATLDSVLAEDGVQANVSALVHEAKVDVIRIPDLVGQMQRGGDTFTQQLTARLTLGATLKGTNGMLVLDKEEEYQSKSASFATLPDIMDRMRQKVSAASQIPMTLLYGVSPGGMNATGESDIRQYYDRVKTIQALDLEPAMTILDECLIRSALGDRPEEIHYNWRPLWQPTAKEKAEVGKLLTESMKSAFDMKALPDEVIGKALVNGLTECGAFPGLEGYAAEYFAEHGEDEPDDAERGEAVPSGGPPPAAGTQDARPRTLYVRRNVLNSAEIISWAKRQGFPTTLAADELHVTIAFSRTPVDWMAVGTSFSPELEVEGGPRLMERFGEARVLLFSMEEMTCRHEQIVAAGASWDFPEYQPHITISYDERSPDLEAVEPYRGRILLGPEIFEEVDLEWKAKVTK